MKAILILAVIAVTCSTSIAATTTERSIILSVGDGPFVFGRVVSLTVSYRNGGKEPWVVPTPSESISVGLRYCPSGSEQHPQGYDFGRITTTPFKGPDGEEMEVRLFPDPKPVSINRGQVHEFKVVLERDWTGDLKPGLWTVWIVDDNLKLESNRIEIPLVFTADSIAACFEVAIDNKQPLYKRKKHAKWLQKIMPDLNLRWPSEDMPADKRLEMEPDIMKGLQSFKVFLNDPNNAGVVEAAIQNINDDPDDNKGSQLQNDGSL